MACALQDQAGTGQPEAQQAVGGKKKKGTHFKNATANFKAEQAEYGVGEEGEQGEEALCESGSWEEWMGGRDEGTGGWDPAWCGQGRYKKRRVKGAQWFNN